MKVSPGAISAMNAAMLAEAPECGCVCELTSKSFVTVQLPDFPPTLGMLAPP